MLDRVTQTGRRRAIAGVAGVLLLALVAGCLITQAGNAQENKEPKADEPVNLVGKAAPAFEMETITGETVKLSALKGKVVLIDVWATWCIPCRETLPHLQEISNNADLKKQGLVVLAVNTGETKEQAKAFVDEKKFTFTVPLDLDSQMMNDYGLLGLPSVILVGRDGIVKYLATGFTSKTQGETDAAIAAALKEK